MTWNQQRQATAMRTGFEKPDDTLPQSMGEILAGMREVPARWQCPTCRRAWEQPRWVGADVVVSDVPGIKECPACDSLRMDWDSALAEERRRRRAKDEWTRLCPPSYRKTEPARLPAKPLADILAWRYGPRGLLAIGPTDEGKTRSMFLLLRRLLDEGREIRAFDCAAFGHECGRRFMDGTGADWTDALAQVEVCFFDDLGKVPMTERVESELFAVVERRTANELPILATSNLTGADLVGKASADRGAPLVRRLREFCEVVVFGGRG